MMIRMVDAVRGIRVDDADVDQAASSEVEGNGEREGRVGLVDGRVIAEGAGAPSVSVGLGGDETAETRDGQGTEMLDREKLLRAAKVSQASYFVVDTPKRSKDGSGSGSGS